MGPMYTHSESHVATKNPVTFGLGKLARDLTRPIDFPQKVAFWKGNGTPKISGKSRLVKYYNLASLWWFLQFLKLNGLEFPSIMAGGGTSTLPESN